MTLMSLIKEFKAKFQVNKKSNLLINQFKISYSQKKRKIKKLKKKIFKLRMN